MLHVVRPSVPLSVRAPVRSCLRPSVPPCVRASVCPCFRPSVNPSVSPSSPSSVNPFPKGAFPVYILYRLATLIVRTVALEGREWAYSTKTPDIVWSRHCLVQTKVVENKEHSLGTADYIQGRWAVQTSGASTQKKSVSDNNQW